MATRPQGYSQTQIVLHWIVAILVVFQIIGHEGMVAAFDAAKEGTIASGFDTTLAWAHVAGGIAIWLFALWRVALRLTRGAPPLPEGEHPALKFVANVVHLVLYALILLMPISGSVAWFGGVEAAGDAHSMARFVLLPAVFLHVAGALYQHYGLKTGVLRRMMKAEA